MPLTHHRKSCQLLFELIFFTISLILYSPQYSTLPLAEIFWSDQSQSSCAISWASPARVSPITCLRYCRTSACINFGRESLEDGSKRANAYFTCLRPCIPESFHDCSFAGQEGSLEGSFPIRCFLLSIVLHRLIRHVETLVQYYKSLVTRSQSSNTVLNAISNCMRRGRATQTPYLKARIYVPRRSQSK